MPHALFLAAFDSQLKWCAQIRTEFEARGFSSRIVVPDVRSALSDSQIAAAGFAAVERATWQETLRDAAASDVVVCALAGPLIKDFSIGLSDLSPPVSGPGPVLVTGWVGVVFEHQTAGYLARCGFDIVAVNSTVDWRHSVQVAGLLDLPVDNLALTGLPFVSARPSEPRGGPIRRVLFADQPTVPSRPAERRYLYTKLLDYARSHPDREVVLKPRHRLDEDTFHRMRYHPETLLADVALPPNFVIDYTPVSEALPTVDLLLTVSSTACLEAVNAGCKVALVLDLGVHERYGNHVFLDSGLLRTFAQIERDEVGQPARPWLDSYFLGHDQTAAEIIADRAEDLLARGLRPSRVIWQSEYFRSAAAYHRSTFRATAPVRAPATRSLRGRMDRHGPVKGVVAHMSYALVPPSLNKPLRSAAKRVGLL